MIILQSDKPPRMYMESGRDVGNRLQDEWNQFIIQVLVIYLSSVFFFFELLKWKDLGQFDKASILRVIFGTSQGMIFLLCV